MKRAWRCALASAILLALLASCKPFGLQEILDTATAKGLSLDPSSVEVPATAAVGFTARGGVPPYRFSLDAGAGSIDASTGRYAAPATAGSAVVRVTDKAGNFATASVTISVLSGGLRLSPSEITITINGSVQFEAIGGTPLYSYAVTTKGSGVDADVNTSTGYYVAGPLPGDDILTVTDAGSGTATATVHVLAAISHVNYAVTGTSLPASGNADTAIPGGSTFTVANSGTAAGTVDFTWKVYLAKGTAPATGDIVLASGSNAALAAGGNVVIPLAGSFPPGCEGSWNLIAEVAAADDLAPADNRSTPSPITIAKKDVNYSVTAITHSSGTVGSGPVSGSFTVDNAGTADGGVNGSWEVLASMDNLASIDDVPIARGTLARMAAADAPLVVPFAGTWPSTAGTWYLVAQVSFGDDSTAADNWRALAAAIAVSDPVVPVADVDYEVTATSNAGGAVAGDPLAGKFSVQNTGADTGTQTLYWNAYRSADAALDVSTDTPIASGTLAALGPLASHTDIPFSGVWPSSPATWYLFVRVSASDDTDPSNNWTVTPPSVTTTEADIDYQVLSLTAPSSLAAGDPFSGGTFQVHNEGSHTGARSVAWTVYRSPTTAMNPAVDPVVDAGSIAFLGPSPASQAVGYDGAWPAASGVTWRLYVVVAAADERSSMTGNNTSAPLDLTTTAPPVDYIVTSVTNVVGLSAGKPFTADFTIKNNDTHAGSADVAWRAYISVDAAPGPGDQLQDSGIVTALGPGATSTGTLAGSWPSAAVDTQYYLAVTVYASDDTDHGNDSGASAQLTVLRPDVQYRVPAPATVTPGVGTAGASFTGTFPIQNSGTDAGSRQISWTAYRSDDATLTVGVDLEIASGTRAAVGASTTVDPAASFSSQWPSSMVTRTYYLFVVISAADDKTTGDNTSPAAAVTVNPPNVDYTIPAAPTWTGTTAGAPVTITLLVKNGGSVGGSSPVTWTVYRSDDNLYTPGVDTVMGYNTVAGLGAGGSINPSFTVTWPEATVARQYYLIARVEAVDDATPGNNEQVSSAITVTPPVVFPDYQVANLTVQTSGTPGAPFAGPNTFQVQNVSANDGTKPITWRVYRSYDAVFDGTDVPVASGTTAQLAGSTTSVPISFGSTCTWPTTGARYRLIVSLDAADDTNPSNDAGVSPLIEVLELAYTEGAEDNGAAIPSTPPLLNVSHMSNEVMTLGRYVQINGSIDKMSWDTYQIKLGAGVTRLGITLKWATGIDQCDIYFEVETGSYGYSIETTANLEEVTFINLTPGQICWIGVKSLTNDNTAPPYQLYLYAEP